MSIQELVNGLIWFGETIGDVLVYVAIAVVFLIGIVRCVTPMLRNRRILKRAARALRSGESKTGWQQETFLGRGSLMPHWNEYLANLFFSDGEYHNPSNVEDYINEETAIEDPGNAAMGSQLPGVMVSLGFLGTLIGMSIGLAGMDFESAEKVMSSMKTLIPGMRYAFMTSIAGVIGSILFTLIISWVSGSAGKALEGFYRAMRSDAGIVTVDPLTQIAVYQQEQSQLLRALSNDLRTTMPKRMGVVMERAMLPVQDSLDNFIAATSREQVRGVERIVDRFVGNMDDSLNGQFEKLAATMAESSRWQQQTGEAVRDTLVGLGQVTRNITEVQRMADSLLVKFDGYVNKLSAAQMQADDSYNHIVSNAQRLDATSEQQSKYLKSITQYQKEFQGTVEEFKGTAQQFAQAMEKASMRSAEALDKASDGIEKNSQVLQNSHAELILGINRGVEDTFGIFDENMVRMTQHLSRSVGDIQKAIDDLPKVLDGTNQRYADQLDQLIFTLQRAQLGLDEAVYRLFPGEQPPNARR